MSEIFKCHSEKQERLIFSEFDETYAITGIQWAKTTSGAWWLKRNMFKYFAKDDHFILAAPNYKIMRQSTLPAFLKIMDGCGEYKAGDAEFHMKGGGKCFMRTGTEPDSVVGITNVRAIWGDEAGKFTKYFWENLKARGSFKRAPKMFTSTPYAANWMFKDVLKPYGQNKLKDTLVVRAKSCDNPYFPMEEYLAKKASMDPRRFNAMYNGEFEKMHGLVFDVFDDDVHVVSPFELPLGTKYYGGVDWGTTHPFVITVRAITPSGDHYQVSEFYKTGLTITDMILVAKQLKQVWGILAFFCDPAQPGLIEEFNRAGCTAMGADNDIRKGIDLHYALLKNNKFKIFRDSSPMSIDEVETYHYPEPEELNPDDDDKEQKPVDQDNHCMDTWRYATISTYHSSDTKSPHVNDPSKKPMSQEERIRRLKRLNKFQRTESWSG